MNEIIRFEYNIYSEKKPTITMSTVLDSEDGFQLQDICNAFVAFAESLTYDRDEIKKFFLNI